jgi:hypothetical protein
MSATPPPDIRSLHDQLEAAEREVQELVVGLSAEQGVQAPEPGRWSVSQCLDHLATGNRVYLQAMRAPADRARLLGRFRQRPANPGVLGGLFVASLEPPPMWWSRLKAPRKIRPRTAPALADTVASFLASQAEVRAFLLANADLDLARIRFPNPFIPWIFFSLATGFHVLVAHGKRHLLQAWGVKRAINAG